MCYTAWASMVAFSIDIVAAIILWNNLHFNFCSKVYPFLLSKKESDNKVFAYVLIGLSTMQIGEYIIHTDMECTGTNQVGSHLAYFSLLFLQPVFSGIALLFGKQRKCGNYNLLLILWQIIFLAYASTSAVGYVEGEYKSQRLDKNVTKWCTTDTVCEHATCSLDWEWDDLNLGSKYPLYFALVMGLPIASLEYWEWWVFGCIVFFSTAWISDHHIFKVAASCFWFPALSLFIQIMTPLPEMFKNLVENMQTRARKDRDFSYI